MARVAAVVFLVALLGGVLAIAGHNPVAALRDLWHRVTGGLTSVEGVTATADREIPGYPAEAAVDGSENAWATTWQPAKPAASGCGETQRAASALVLSLPARTEVRRLDVASGLPGDDKQRDLQWRPSQLDVTFSDGSCQRIMVTDTAGLQRHRIDPVETDRVTVAISAVTPASEKKDDPRVSVTEIRLLRRPG